MKRRPIFIPSPIAIVSAALTFVLLGFFVAAAAAVVPQLLELMKTQPRLAMVGFLGFTISPAAVTVVAHHFGHRLLDRFDTNHDWRDRVQSGKPSLFPKVESWWAGVQAWMTIYAASIVTRLIMLVIFPPEPQPDNESIFSLTGMVSEMSRAVTLHNAASLHTGIWIVIAAWMYEVERRASRRRKKHDE
jgi:hypothetical protein